MKGNRKSGDADIKGAPSQLPLDLNPPSDTPPVKRPADVISISTQRTATVRDALVEDLIASKAPKKS